MFSIEIDSSLPKPAFYKELCQLSGGLLSSETDGLANCANLGSLLYHTLPDVNWVGFYLLRDDDELVLGPFQGQPACVRIPVGRGVCGTAAKENKVQRVGDVMQFSGHIACDAKTESEIVLPVTKNGNVIAVLDIDSPVLRRFDEDDQAGLEVIVSQVEKYVDLSWI